MSTYAKGVAAKCQHVLASLKDIEGVQGSFLVVNPGELLSRDLPSLFADEFLNSAAPRLTRLWDTLGTMDRSLDQLVLRFDEHKLYLRPVVQGLLCVVTPTAVNMAALRMAANLVIKRINPILAELDWEQLKQRPGGIANEASADTPPSAKPESAPTPASEGTAPRSKRTMVYRGRRYEV